MLTTLTYFQIFSLFFYNIGLLVLPGLFSYKTFSLVLAIITAVAIIKCLLSKKSKVDKRVITVSLAFIIVIIMYRFVTPLQYRITDPGYFSGEFLALSGQVFPAAITALLIANQDEVQSSIKKSSLIVSVVFSVVSFYLVLNSKNKTSAGLISTDVDMTYQTLSYMAAFSAALSDYYLLCFANSNRRNLHLIAYLTIALDAAIVIISGGRGGFVLYCFFILLSAYYALRKKGGIRNKNLKRIIYIVVAVIIASFVIKRIQSSQTVNSNGVERVFSLFANYSDAGRNYLRNQAFRSFWESPIIGHGFGSVFFELGQYSHNIFTDLLVETGIIGTGVFIVILYQFFRKAKMLIKEDSSDILWIFLFFSGFLMLLFSSYYCAVVIMWWPVFLVYGKSKNTKTKPPSVEIETRVQYELS